MTFHHLVRKVTPSRDVEELSDGRVKLTAGTLYGALNRLTEDGLIGEPP